ncbi:hypothetical protein TCAL_14684 [Tigriopus californicus]|uniref:Uncharacterized protein n=1 Tax=Tigriopus californicus TaxID=6832 RepID=A0A553NQB2_TIGCA|nr:hypothetical protein TCAL_14684 [Tigriopus californicus]
MATVPDSDINTISVIARSAASDPRPSGSGTYRLPTIKNARSRNMNGNRAPPITTDSSKKGEKDGSTGVMVDMKACNAFASAARSARAASALAKKPRIQNEVKSFTRESLEKINLRTSNLIRDYGFLPKRSPNLQDGAQLPAKYEPFPAELLGKPVEELDQYVYEKVRATTPDDPIRR